MCVLWKILEKIVYNRILEHVKDIIIPQQHGFLPNRSIETNLITFVDSLYESMDKRVPVDVVYTDFSKAFDKINHQLLIDRLAETGIDGILLWWIESYLKNRNQLVTVNGYRSDLFRVPSGVPQGSHLGPLFFIVYINDILIFYLNIFILISVFTTASFYFTLTI